MTLEPPPSLADFTPEARGEDHAPHPETCLRRLLETSSALRDSRYHPTAPESLAILLRLGAEVGHLAVLDDCGVLEPLWSMFHLLSWTPEQAAVLARAQRKWAERQEGEAQ